jgi:hypothetical protein
LTSDWNKIDNLISRVNCRAVEESRARTWKKIGCFYTLTMLFAGVFGALVMHAGKMDAGSTRKG